MLNIYSILYAQIIVYLILINLLKFINIDNEKFNLFKSYYSNHKNLIIDFIISYIIIKLNEKYNIKSLPKLHNRILMIIIFDLILSLYIRYTPFNNQYILFLKKWAYLVGWFAILWDIIYFLSIAKLADKINNIELIKKYSFSIMLCFGFILLHL